MQVIMAFEGHRHMWLSKMQLDSSISFPWRRIYISVKMETSSTSGAIASVSFRDVLAFQLIKK